MEASNFKKKETLLEDQGFILYAGENLITKEEVWIKEIDPEQYQEGKFNLEALYKLSENTHSFSSPNLVKTLHEWDHNGKFYQAVENCQLDLQSFILQQYSQDPEEQAQYPSPGTICEHDAVLIIKDLLQGLQDMYELGYVHRDISSQNVMIQQITDDPVLQQRNFKNQQLKVLQFKINEFNNMSDELDFDKFQSGKQQYKVIGDASNLSLNQESFNYTSPQILELMLGKNTQYSSKTDVFSLGIIFYELLFGQRPFEPKLQIPEGQQIDLQDILDFKLTMMQNQLQFPVRKPITNMTRDFLQRALVYSEDQRLSLVDVFKHELFRPYFTELYNDLRISQLNQSKLQTKSAQVIQKLRKYVDEKQKDLGELFKLVDTDGNGFLDEGEFFQMLQKIDSSLTKMESDSLFRKLDISKNKQITIKEFNKIFINQKIPKRVTQKIELIKKLISDSGKQVSDIFDKHHMGNGIVSYMEFNEMIKSIVPNFDTNAINQLFSFISDNKGTISKKQFVQKLSVNYNNQQDFLLEEDIKELALRQMSNLREIFKEKNIDILQLFYQNLSGQSTYVHHNEISTFLIEYVSKKDLKYIYEYYEYLHNRNRKINWELLAKDLYPRGNKTKLQAMELINTLKKILSRDKSVINWNKQFFDKEYIKNVYQDQASEEEVDVLFDYFDLDKDGLISKTELKCQIYDFDEQTKHKAHEDLKKLRKYIKRNEINVDQLLLKYNTKLFGLPEFRQIFYNLSEEEATFLYQYIDNDSNGWVTYDEIKEVLTEQDPRMVEQASELMKSLKYTLEKRNVDVLDLLSKHNIGEGDRKKHYINRAMMLDMFERQLTEKKVRLIHDVYGEPQTEMIYYKDLINMLTNNQEAQKKQSDTKQSAMQHLNKLKEEIVSKGINFKERFQLYDLKGEGFLTFKNIKSLFNDNKIQLNDEELGEICDFLDEDGNNEISYSEIARYLGQEKKRQSTNTEQVAQEAFQKLSKLLKNYDVNLKELMSTFDTYGNGQLNLEQFKNCSLFEEFKDFNEMQINAMFKFVSGDSNSMHYKEFVRAVM